MSEFEAKTRVYQRLLKTLVADAAHNEVVMAHCQEQELALLAAEDLAQLLERLTTGLRRSFGLDEVVLLILDPYKVMKELMEALDVDPRKYPGLRLTHNPGELSLCGGLFDCPVLTAWDQRRHGKLFLERGLHSVATLPMHRSDGLVGCLALGSRNPGRFTQEHATEFLQRLATISAVCLENAVNRERLRLLGLTDPLTGLYNRRHLEQRLQEEVARSLRYHQPLSCLFVDADNFKRINDAYGHTAGDQVLQQLAQRLRGVLRRSDLAARYGGEEFALLLPQTDASQARQIAERIRARIADRPIELCNNPGIHCTVSIGVAELGDRRCIEDPAITLIQQADQAVYLAKEQGRNRVVGSAKRR